jgi:hypothetical protein
MGLFKRHQKSAGLNTYQQQVTDKLNAVLIRRQTQVAQYLDRKTYHWNRKSKLIALFLFCLIFGSLSLFLLMKACN